jgi:WD40 repeat protein
MSATYLLAHVSTGSAGGGDSTSNLNEQGHSDAVWCMSWTKLMDGRSVVITTGADHTIKIWDATNGAKPFKTIRPDCLALVGLAVDPSPDGAKFIIVNSLDSVITRWSVEGELEGMKELGSGEFIHFSLGQFVTHFDVHRIAESWGLSLHPKSLNLATAGTEAKIRIMSSSIENFGEILSVAEGRGTFGMAVEYVSLIKSTSFRS